MLKCRLPIPQLSWSHIKLFSFPHYLFKVMFNAEELLYRLEYKKMLEELRSNFVYKQCNFWNTYTHNISCAEFVRISISMSNEDNTL